MAEDVPSGVPMGDISTLWTLVLRAGGAGEGLGARQELCRRYHGAATRFLRAALGDEHAAAELGQEFAVRVLNGDLGGAAPDRGRFRDYVKGVLRHMIVDHYRRGRREVQPASRLPEPEAPADDPAELDRQWVATWRQELLDRPRPGRASRCTTSCGFGPTTPACGRTRWPARWASGWAGS